MRKLLTWIVVTLGIAALIRRLKRRGAEAEPTPIEPPGPAGDPANELRQKLAESRSADETQEAPAPEETVEERRAEVHDQGRATLDEMRPSDEEQ
jgi:flagellar biosynthesis/type III secretory pathway M-ring protein FliF/YscJ